MQKNCSRCKSKHIGPFGSRCKAAMAVLDGFDRNDPKYLKQLEDEFCELKLNMAAAAAAGGGVKPKEEPSDAPTRADMKRVMDSLNMITDRISKLETGPLPHRTGSGDSTTTASLISDPLTKALAKLTGDEDDIGKALRPETYSQHELKEKARDHNKLDTVGLFYGWVCIAQHLMKTGGDLASYMNHVRYATGMLHTRQFYDIGAIKYDRQIVDKYLENKSSGFAPDPVISSLTFSSKLIPDSVELCPGASLTKGVTSFQAAKSANRGRRRSMAGRRSDEIPPDFPHDICFWYNYRQCVDENCSKSHVCRKCSGKHRADSCRERTRKS